ncbi:uncharacterized protein METZ01_LOCUS440611 [marine metagenome]|uniref:Uncharacterized protein n=1 Tax=marine metagenome TaxID=408172 RepID=A0A382YWV4_9ZZZZ
MVTVTTRSLGSRRPSITPSYKKGGLSTRSYPA